VSARGDKLPVAVRAALDALVAGPVAGTLETQQRALLRVLARLMDGTTRRTTIRRRGRVLERHETSDPRTRLRAIRLALRLFRRADQGRVGVG
jgi:hypothetical protein